MHNAKMYGTALGDHLTNLHLKNSWSVNLGFFLFNVCYAVKRVKCSWVRIKIQKRRRWWCEFQGRSNITLEQYFTKGTRFTLLVWRTWRFEIAIAHKYLLCMQVLQWLCDCNGALFFLLLLLPHCLFRLIWCEKRNTWAMPHTHT